VAPGTGALARCRDFTRRSLSGIFAVRGGTAGQFTGRVRSLVSPTPWDKTHRPTHGCGENFTGQAKPRLGGAARPGRFRSPSKHNLFQPGEPGGRTKGLQPRYLFNREFLQGRKPERNFSLTSDSTWEVRGSGGAVAAAAGPMGLGPTSRGKQGDLIQVRGAQGTKKKRISTPRFVKKAIKPALTSWGTGSGGPHVLAWSGERDSRALLWCLDAHGGAGLLRARWTLGGECFTTCLFFAQRWGPWTKPGETAQNHCGT